MKSSFSNGQVAYNFGVWLSTDNLECIFCEYIFIWNLPQVINRLIYFYVVYVLSFLWWYVSGIHTVRFYMFIFEILTWLVYKTTISLIQNQYESV